MSAFPLLLEHERTFLMCSIASSPDAPAGGGGRPFFRRRTSPAWGWLV